MNTGDGILLIVLWSCQQESLQGALGASHEDDYWLPISCRHSHQKRFNHQEQICCLRNALCASFHFLVLFVVGAYVYLAAKTAECNLEDKKRNSPRLPAKSFLNFPRTYKSQEKILWKTAEHESSLTLTMRGINRGGDLECILY